MGGREDRAAIGKPGEASVVERGEREWEVGRTGQPSASQVRPLSYSVGRG